MRLLVVKTSSLGDILHTFPALSDAAAALPGLEAEWLVDESFASLPGWHPAVRRVHVVPWRRLRYQPWRAFGDEAVRRFRRTLRERPFDLVLDAQGLVRTAALARWAGFAAGPDLRSAREPVAALLYRERHPMPSHRAAHAVERARTLFARALGYPLPAGPPEFGLTSPVRLPGPTRPASVTFLHGTTWASKEWPEPFWAELGRRAASSGLEVLLPAQTTGERARAERIAAGLSRARVLCALPLDDMAGALLASSAVVGVDTGLTQLAAALGVPTLALHGPSDPRLTGARGPRTRHLAAVFPCAPCLSPRCSYAGPSAVVPACYSTLGPDAVWSALREMLPVGEVASCPA